MTITLEQYYSLPDLQSTYNIPTIIHPQLDLFPELVIYGSFNRRSLDNIKLNNIKVSFRMKVGELYSFDKYQDRWVWVLAALYYGETPIGVVRNPTDQIDAYPNIFITEPNVYREAVNYLWGFMEPDYEASPLEYMPLSGSITPHTLRMNPIPSYEVSYVEKAIQQSIDYNRFK